MSAWPALLPVPSPADYTLQPQSGVTRSDMDSGEARQRRRFRSVATNFSVKHEFTKDEFAIFEYWFENEIDGGAAWFELPLANGQGVVAMQARYREPFAAQLVKTCLFWDVTSQLEVRKRPLYSRNEYEAIALYGGVVALAGFASAYHDVINVDYPEATGAA